MISRLWGLGALAVPMMVQFYTVTHDGKMILVNPPLVIAVLHNHDEPAFDYYPPLDNYINPTYPVVS